MKRFRTVIEVPCEAPSSWMLNILPFDNLIPFPLRSETVFVISDTSETEAILGNASPRNPKVEIESRSISEYSLLVANL